jgi:ribosomal protein S18 acetylase RimI-like enzyme
MPQVMIRPAQEEDIAILAELNRVLFREDSGQRDPWVDQSWPDQHGTKHFAELVAGEKGVCLLAELGDEVVGYLAGYTWGPSDWRPVRMAELESMFILEQFRGQQVGSVLVEGFLAWCRKRDVQRVSVTAYATNEGALAFYRSLGFVPKNLTLEIEIS